MGALAGGLPACGGILIRSRHSREGLGSVLLGGTTAGGGGGARDTHRWAMVGYCPEPLASVWSGDGGTAAREERGAGRIIITGD